MALTHFDVHGCFGDPSWDALVDAFRSGGSLQQAGAPRHLLSESAACDVGGIVVPLALEFRVPLESPGSGFQVLLDVSAFHAYFEEDALGTAHRPLCERQRDYLHVACVLLCSEGMQRLFGGVLSHDSARTMRECELSCFWHFTPFGNGMGQALSIEVQASAAGGDGEGGDGDEVFWIDEELGNARWNGDLPHGTELAPLVWVPDNEFGAESFESVHDLVGAVALIRRGGGCGFAQKALAAQDAGAVGCIIYEVEGDREAMGHVFTMGLRFGGRDYPAPGIPCLLVDAKAGARLVRAAQGPSRALARISLDRSAVALRRLSHSFEAFRRTMREGEPAHLAVLVERVAKPDGQPFAGLEIPMLSWFEASRSLAPEANTSYEHVATVQIV